MPGGGNSQTSSQTTSSGPWKPTQPYLKDAMSEAQRLYENDKGFKPFPGEGYVPFSSQSQTGLNQMQSLASKPNQFYGGAADFTKGLIGGKYNLDQSGYQGLMGQNPNAISQYGTGIASGAQGIGTEGDYRSMLGNQNAEFENVVQNTANDVGDQIQRQFGGASYGSGSNADYLTKGVGDVVSRMRSDNFFNNQNLQRGLLGDISGIQGQNINNRLGAAGMLSGEQQQGFGNTRGLLGDMSNLSQMDIQNRMGGLGMADSVYNSQYLPAERMLGVGGAYEGKAGEKLQSEMDAFNTKQMAPWDRLAQAFGMFSGTGAQGNRVQTSVSQPTDIWSKLLGGGLLASQVF